MVFPAPMIKHELHCDSDGCCDNFAVYSSFNINTIGATAVETHPSLKQTTAVMIVWSIRRKIIRTVLCCSLLCKAIIVHSDKQLSYQQ